MIRYLIAAYSLMFYIAIRSASYVTSPRPYLWWHFILDVLVVIVWISAVLLLGALIEKRKSDK